ncbi:hypothetical protein BJX99DRAFT_254066 [Aspergillus californicus]
MSSSTKGSLPQQGPITQLPNELLELIFKFFVQHADGYRDSINQQALYSLCLTSPTFRAVAQPLLFYTVHLEDSGLHRTLLQIVNVWPHLAEYVKCLVFSEELTWPTPPDEQHQITARMASMTLAPHSTSRSPAPGPPAAQPSASADTYQSRESLRGLWKEVALSYRHDPLTTTDLQNISYLWHNISGVSRLFTQKYQSIPDGGRVAAIELVGLLLSLPKLRYFSLVGFRDPPNQYVSTARRMVSAGNHSPSLFQEIFTGLVGIAARRDLDLFAGLKDVEFTQLKDSADPCLVHHLMGLPKLRRLTIDSFEDYPEDDGEDDSDEGIPSISPVLSTTSSPVRKLHLAFPQIDLGVFSSMMKRIECLEVLHYELGFPIPVYASGLSWFDQFIALVEMHKETLKEFRFTSMPVFDQALAPARAILHPWCFADFSNLMILDVPDILLHSTASYPLDPRGVLPPRIVFLTLAVQFCRREAFDFIKDLSDHRSANFRPTLQMIKVVEHPIDSGVRLVDEATNDN